MGAPDYPALLTNHFGGCLGQDIQPDSEFDTETIKSWCGVWRAFEDGCSVVMWTDPYAVIHSPKLDLQYWMESNQRADVYWSLNNPGAAKWCAKHVKDASADLVRNISR